MILRTNPQHRYRQALRSITIRPDAAFGRGSTRHVIARALSEMEDQGWAREALEDGSVRYTRPGPAAAAFGEQSVRPATGGIVPPAPPPGAVAGRAAPVPESPTFVSDVAPSLAPDDFQVKITKVMNDPDGLADVAERTSRLKAEGIVGPNARTTFRELQKRAGGVDLDEVVGAPPSQAITDVESVAIKDAYSDNFNTLAEAYEKAQVTPPGTEERRMLDAGIAALEQRQDALLARYIPGASQSGRNLAALRYQARQSLDPMEWFTKAQKMMPAGAELTSDLKRQITTFIKNEDREGLVQFINSLQQPLTWRDPKFYTTFWKSFLISGIASPGRAILGNTARAAYDTAATPTRVLMDAALEKFLTGERTSMLPGRVQMQAALKGFREGIGRGKRVMTQGLTPEAAQKLEVGQSQRLDTPFKAGPVDPVTGQRKDLGDLAAQIPFRAQGALDQPFSRTAFRRSLAEQAEIIARRVEGLDSPEAIKQMRKQGVAPDAARELAERNAAERVEYLTENPTPEMTLRSQVAAAYSTFQNESVAGGLAQGLRRAAARHPVSEAVADIFIPFSRTPGAIIGAAAESTPLGALSTMADLHKLRAMVKGPGTRNPALERALQAKMTRRGSRWITGLWGMVLGMELFKDGNIVTGKPNTPTERDQFYREGKRPFSVRMNVPGVGPRWVSLTQLQPLGATLAFGAELAEAEGNPAAQLAEAAIGSSARMALETPFMRGTSEAIDILEDESSQRLNRFSRNAAANLIAPNLLAGEARVLDPEIKDVQSLGDAVKARVPGLSRAVPGQVDPLTGDVKVRETEETQPPPGVNLLLRTIGSSPDRTFYNPLLREMERVGAAVGGRRQNEGESREQYRDRLRVEGRILTAALTALTDPEADQAMLATAQVNPDQVRAYRLLQAADDQTPEILQLQADIIEKVARDIRSRITNELRKER